MIENASLDLMAAYAFIAATDVYCLTATTTLTLV
jgi:hypothetical protein